MLRILQEIYVDVSVSYLCVFVFRSYSRGCSIAVGRCCRGCAHLFALSPPVSSVECYLPLKKKDSEFNFFDISSGFSGAELLLDDSTRMAEKMKAAGVEVILDIWPEL